MAPFNHTFIYMALGTALGLGATHACANEFINPHQIINLTNKVAQYTGKGTQVGVLDSGFFINHPLANKEQLRPIAFTLNDTKGKTESYNPSHYSIEENVINEDTGETIKSYATHGGQVAGIIGAKPLANQINDFEYMGGVAQNTKIYLSSASVTETPQKQSLNTQQDHSSLLLDTDEETVYERKVLSTGLNKLAENQLLAINNSWNEDPFSENVAEIDGKYKDAIANAKDNELINAIKKVAEKETILVFAAGNESKTQTGVMASLPRFLPNLEKHYLSVISTDKDNKLESYSNHCGISKNWCISAPGSLAVLTVDGYEDGVEDFGLTAEKGTSYSAPTVTGSLALIKERFGYFSSAQVRDTLLTTATDLGEKGVDDTFGWGLVNLEKAIKGPSQLLNDETFHVSQDDTWQNDLTTEHTFTKQGSGHLTLTGKNRLDTIHINDGKLTLAGQTSTNQIQNKTHLIVADLTVNQSFITNDNATLELITPNGIQATGDKTTIQLAGTLSVSDKILTDKKAGDTAAKVLTLTNGASYQGGFKQLQKNDKLSNQGLRQDLYFNENGVLLTINADTPFIDDNTNTNAKNGLDLLNQLRNTPTAWRAGTYNTWLQKAIGGDLQTLHYQVGNTLYADNLELLRHYHANQLHQRTIPLGQYEQLKPKQLNVWLNQNREKYQTNKGDTHIVRDFDIDETQLKIASLVNNNVVIAGSWTHSQIKSDKSSSHSKIKQNQTGLSLHYAPQPTGWFADISGQYGNIKYQQQRNFNSSLLGMANNKGSVFGTQINAGYGIKAGHWLVKPSLGVQTLRFHMQALNEQGDMAILTPSIKQTDVNLVTTVQTNRSFMINDWQITPQINLDYIHRLNNDKTHINGQLAGLAINNEASTNHRGQLETGLAISVGRHGWFGTLGVKQRKLRHSDATQIQMAIGAEF